MPHGGLEWITAEEAARRMGRDVRSIQMRCPGWARYGRAEKRKCAGGGKSRWFVRGDADQALLIGSPTVAGMQASLESEFGLNHAHRAYRSYAALDRWLQLCSGRQALPDHLRLMRKTPTAADLAKAVIAEFAKSDPGLKVSVSTLKEWKRKFREGHGHIRALVPKYKGGDGSGTGDGSATTRSAGAINFFYALFHTESRLAVSTCHEMTLAEAQRAGWSWPASLSATRRWLDEHDDLSLTFLMREGKKAWCRKFMSYVEMDWDAVGVGQWFVTDHTQCDFWVEFEGKQIRPWLTVMLDCRSRCIVGWNLGPTPHQDAILAALRMALRDWCIPDYLRVDNGKDFTSKLLTGVTKMERAALKRLHGDDFDQVDQAAETMVACDDTRWRGIIPELGIKIIYAIPYAPWSKGLVERWFGTFHGQCGKTFASYCGNSPTTRPEALADIREGCGVPTFEEAHERIGDYIKQYHAQRHGTLQAAPLSVWQSADRLRRADVDALALLLDIRGEYKVGANGVSLTVGPARFTYGASHPALARLRGRSVLVRLDTADVSQCWVYDVKTRSQIARLTCNEKIVPGTSGEEVREAVGQRMRDRKVAHAAARSAAKRTRTAVAAVNAHVHAKRRTLRATGTEGKADFQPTIVPVRTGFEGISTAPQKTFELPPEDDVYAGISLVDLAGGDDEPAELSFAAHDAIDAEPDAYAGIQLTDLESESDDNDGDIYAGIELSALGNREDEDDLLG